MKYADRVKETTATTGTGTLALAGAVVGFRTFLSALADGDLVPYIIEAANGTDWETGIGTYSAGTLARTTITASSNSNNAINLSAGNHTVYHGLIAKNLTDQREVLTAARTYYVRTDGNDSNSGLANTAGGAFLTIQKALDVVYALDLSIYNVTIKVADGTYTAGIAAVAPFTGKGVVTIEGNVATPANCIISVASANCVSATKGANLTVTGFKLTTATGSYSCVYAAELANLTVAKMEYGSATFMHIYGAKGAMITSTGPNTISGGATGHLYGEAGAIVVEAGAAITLTGTPAFSNWFVGANSSLIKTNDNTYTGTATGARYLATRLGMVDINGASLTTYLPGNSNGSVSIGGLCG